MLIQIRHWFVAGIVCAYQMLLHWSLSNDATWAVAVCGGFAVSGFAPLKQPGARCSLLKSATNAFDFSYDALLASSCIHSVLIRFGSAPSCFTNTCCFMEFN